MNILMYHSGGKSLAFRRRLWFNYCRMTTGNNANILARGLEPDILTFRLLAESGSVVRLTTSFYLDDSQISIFKNFSIVHM